MGAERDREEWEGWIWAARSRMGAEQFGRLMAMRCGPDGRDGRFGRDRGGFGRDRHAPHHAGRKETPRRPQDQHPDDPGFSPEEPRKPRGE